MRIIELDAKNWQEPVDFSNDLLAAVGAPDWNGTSIQALLDSLIWDGLNKEKPPYTLQIKNTKNLSKKTLEDIQILIRCIADQRAESIKRRGYDVDVNLVVIS